MVPPSYDLVYHVTRFGSMRLNKAHGYALFEVLSSVLAKRKGRHLFCFTLGQETVSVSWPFSRGNRAESLLHPLTEEQYIFILSSSQQMCPGGDLNPDLPRSERALYPLSYRGTPSLWTRAKLLAKRKAPRIFRFTLGQETEGFWGPSPVVPFRAEGK